jgi:predicted glycosyltransferase
LQLTAVLALPASPSHSKRQSLLPTYLRFKPSDFALRHYTLQGNTTVMVERRSSAKSAYGQGNKAPMQLQQLVKELQQGNTGLYMSTQEVKPLML